MGRVFCLVFFFYSVSNWADNKPTSNPADAPYPSGGDAHGIGGGDSVDNLLSVVQKDLRRAFQAISEKNQGVCEANYCPLNLEQRHCRLLKGLTPAERSQCQATVSEMATYWSGQSTLFEVSLTEKPLTLNENGENRPISAMTLIGAKGSITFHRSRIEAMTMDDLVALTAHELGHKFPYRGGWIKDTGRYGAFSSGRRFLDATGAAIAVMANIHRIPVQSPPDLRVARVDYCKRVKAGDSAFILGVSQDSGEALQPSTKLRGNGLNERLRLAERVLTGKKAKEAFVRRWFQRLYRRNPSEEEMTMLVLSLSHEANAVTLLSAMVQDGEYIHSRRIIRDSEYLTQVLSDFLGRAPEAPVMKRELASFKGRRRADYVVKLLSENSEVLSALVGDWYKRFLNRVPTDNENRAHVRQLQSGVAWETVQATIVSGPEYTALQNVRAKPCTGEGSRVKQGQRSARLQRVP